MTLSPLPPELNDEFSLRAARELGVSSKRLRMRDLETPFRGVRMRRPSISPAASLPNTFLAAKQRENALIRALGTRLAAGQFFCGRSAALLWGAPMPHVATPQLHLGVVHPRRAPRQQGVTGHAYQPSRVSLTEHRGLPLTSAPSTFAALGALPLVDLVAVGDYFVRKYRAGYGRPNAGRDPLASIAELQQAVELGRWQGAARLRTALSLIREDAWSPRESLIRVLIVLAGLPEPELNVDLFDGVGVFLGCFDLLYRQHKIVIEYQGEQHSATYAQDIERVERLRAAGWVVLQVTKMLANQPDVLVARVRHELRARGWHE